jgi:hypothetical protein
MSFNEYTLDELEYKDIGNITHLMLKHQKRKRNKCK